MSKYCSYTYEERVEKEIEYICNYGYTLREVAKIMGISKSTIHLDVTKKLEKHSYSNYLKVRSVLDEHKATWHLKGGEATKQKFKKLKEK